MTKSSSIVFDENTKVYDSWFERHDTVYQSELLAIKQAIPNNKRKLKLGLVQVDLLNFLK